ncbi:MAG TPA: hypothetical protein VK997_01575 [Deferrisomatales bacterium]|nr:hypothetical protein [Deferrisomatales bacterium]
MNRTNVLALLLVMAMGCATAPPPRVSVDDQVPKKVADDKGACFEAALANSFIPGRTTKQEIFEALGKPYPDPRMTDEFWTYLYTYQKHVSFVFDGDVMVERRWGTEYGIAVESDQCWPSFERVVEQMRKRQEAMN